MAMKLWIKLLSLIRFQLAMNSKITVPNPLKVGCRVVTA